MAAAASIVTLNLSSSVPSASASASTSTSATSSLSFSSQVPSFSALRIFPRIQQRRPTFTKIFAFSSNDIKVGANIEVDGAPWRVMEFLHVKPGKGAAYIRTTLRNYVTGNSVEKTFRAGSKIELADIFKETKQYTYKDGAQYVFMDLTTYEESRLNEVDIGDKGKWMKEGMDCILLYWNGKVDPGLKGDTAQGGSKPATLETGAVVNVPLFIEKGQAIMVDSRTGQYMSRA